MSDPRVEPTEEMVGYQAAADYLGLKRNTLSAYCSRGAGPKLARSTFRGQYVQPVFTRAELDRWRANRPGQGRRTDLVEKPEAIKID